MRYKILLRKKKFFELIVSILLGFPMKSPQFDFVAKLLIIYFQIYATKYVMTNLIRIAS